MAASLPASWQGALGGELGESYFVQLQAFLASERAEKEIFPPESEVFSALELTPFDDVKVLLLGQDPYHDDGQAHGLCFSVKPPTKPPPSLRNIFNELQADVGVAPPGHGDLTAWAKQGVLLLNAVLTVHAHQANSHKDRGWETFTDAIISAVSARKEPVVFCLWGAYARKKVKLIDVEKHTVIEGAHPSPLSVAKFKGSKPFSAINTALVKQGQAPIDWKL
ncbi:MAG: uracil-DNA glycosylase [Deltaproteobacteria bacterium]|nr:uracil-DNA glycosylase [Deltaproteobacteria bacterium]